MTIGENYAFPVDGRFANDAMRHGTAGLTKREYFAAMAMQANADNDEETPAQIATKAVELADALINALNEGGEL